MPWCIFIAIVFVIALPDHAAIFTVGMPGLGTVPLTALPAADFAGEKVDSAVSALAGFPAFQLTLYLLEHVRADNGFVVAFYIILRNFTLVNFFFLVRKSTV